MGIQEIKDAMAEAVVARGCFIVDVRISKDNDIELTVESERGTVTIDDCVALSREFEAKFDRDAEDYSLTVTSAGLDQPFKVLGQYIKAVGTEVEVSLRGGRRFRAKLLSADEEGITVEYEATEAVEGSKKKMKVQRSEKFPFSDITGVRPVVDF